MRLSELIPPEDVILDVNVRDKPQALKFIAEELSIDRLLEPERVRQALAAREELGSTGIGRGIALPHVCLKELDGFRALFVRLAPPIDFNAVDGKPVDLIFTIISPTAKEGSPYKPLSLLAAVCRMLQDEAVAGELRHARSASSVCKIFRRLDAAATNPVR
jgi:PTS system nitrogen regulatory IIA component